jgi:2-amino-4-hydroxy-6-hydroxymethyldihydropteridine diphosphokinase
VDVPDVSVVAVSPYHETAPVGGPSGQGAFLNAAAAVETTRSPEDLLAIIREIESSAGRVRSVHWAERTLDLDILVYGDRVIDGPNLQVPHPRLTVRRFVLAPLAEIAPEVREPRTRRTIKDLLANVDRRPSYIAIPRDPASARDQLVFTRVVAELNAGNIELAQADTDDINKIFAHVNSFFERHLQLQPGSPSDTTANDRWLVSDFWLDEIMIRHLHEADGATDEPALGPARDRVDASLSTAAVDPDVLDSRKTRVASFFALRATSLAPTFVAINRARLERLRLYDPEREWQRPIGWDTPVVVLDSEEPGAMASDILAACESSRTPSPSH